MRIYKSFFRFEKCRKACKYRLYRLMRTYKEIVKNYILISYKNIELSLEISDFLRYNLDILPRYSYHDLPGLS